MERGQEVEGDVRGRGSQVGTLGREKSVEAELAGASRRPERVHRPANDVVTTAPGKQGTQEAGKRCLVFSPYILEAEGGDGSRISAKERCE